MDILMTDLLTAQEELEAILSIPYFLNDRTKDAEHKQRRFLETWKTRTPAYQQILSSVDPKVVEKCSASSALWMAAEVAKFPSHLDFARMSPLVMSLEKKMVEDTLRPAEAYELLASILTLVKKSLVSSPKIDSKLETVLKHVINHGFDQLDEKQPSHHQLVSDFLDVCHANIGNTMLSQFEWDNVCALPFMANWIAHIQVSPSSRSTALLKLIEVDFIKGCLQSVQKTKDNMVLSGLSAALPHLQTPHDDPRWTEVSKMWKVNATALSRWDQIHDTLNSGLSHWPTSSRLALLASPKKIEKLFASNTISFDGLLQTTKFSSKGTEHLLPLIAQHWQKYLFHTLTTPLSKTDRPCALVLQNIEKNKDLHAVFHSIPMNTISWGDWASSGTLGSYEGTPAKIKQIQQNIKRKEVQALLKMLPESVRNTLMLVHHQQTDGQSPLPDGAVANLVIGKKSVPVRFKDDAQKWVSLFEGQNLRVALASALDDPVRSTRVKKM